MQLVRIARHILLITIACFLTYNVWADVILPPKDIPQPDYTIKADWHDLRTLLLAHPEQLLPHFHNASILTTPSHNAVVFCVSQNFSSILQVNSTVIMPEYTMLEHQILIPFTINLIPFIKQLASTLPGTPIVETMSLKLVPVQVSNV
jgi:hypothetical protein